MYAKVFEQIFDSSISKDYTVRHVFMDLLVLADMEGVVDKTLDAIARRLNMPEDVVKKCLDQLMAPDPESRTPGDEGRRIRLISEHRDWGWVIVNYDHYRRIRDEEGRRSYHRNYMRTKRTGKVLTPVKVCEHLLTPVMPGEPIQKQKKMEMNIPESSKFPKFSEFWKAFPINKGDRSKALDAWKILGCEKIADTIIQSVRDHSVLPDWTKDGGKWIPSVVKFLSERKWENKIKLDAPKTSGIGTGIFAPGAEMDPNRTQI